MWIVVWGRYNHLQASVADASILDFVSGLLGVPSSFLKTALEVRQMETKHGNNRGTQYKVPLNRIQVQLSVLTSLLIKH